LEKAGLVTRDIRGREHLLSFDDRPLRAASHCIDLLRRHWDESFDRLEEMLRERPNKGNAKPTDQQMEDNDQ